MPSLRAGGGLLRPPPVTFSGMAALAGQRKIPPTVPLERATEENPSRRTPATGSSTEGLRLEGAALLRQGLEEVANGCG